MNNNLLTLDEIIGMINKKCPLIPFTNSSRIYSTVRRMKIEKEIGIPIKYRAGFSISVKTGHRANEMSEAEFEEYYAALCNQLRGEFPKLYLRVFPI